MDLTLKLTRSDPQSNYLLLDPLQLAKMSRATDHSSASTDSSLMVAEVEMLLEVSCWNFKFEGWNPSG